MNETIKRIQNGEHELLEGLILDNMNYIDLFIKNYDGKIRDYEDLKQECIKEFVKAVYSYEFKYDFKKSYLKIKLYTCVQRYLVKHIDDFMDKDERYAFCVRLFELVKRRLGHEPSAYEFKKCMLISETDTIKIFKILQNPEIRNTEYKDSIVVSDFYIGIFNESENQEKCELIEQATSLTLRQKELLLYHYGFKNGQIYSFSDMARLLDSHRQVYSDANKSLLKKIKKKILE